MMVFDFGILRMFLGGMFSVGLDTLILLFGWTQNLMSFIEQQLALNIRRYGGSMNWLLKKTMPFSMDGNVLVEVRTLFAEQ